MSWSIQAIGTKKAVIAKVRRELEQQNHLTAMQIVQRIQQIPDPTSVNEYGTPTPWDSATHVAVFGAGHGGAIGGLHPGMGGLVIHPFVMAPEPVEVPVEQTAPIDSQAPAASEQVPG